MAFAFVFPGQGSQSVGMLGALAAVEASIRGTFDEASAVLGFDLWKLVSEGPEEALNATVRTQPAMLVAGGAGTRRRTPGGRRRSQSRGIHRTRVRASHGLRRRGGPGALPRTGHA